MEAEIVKTERDYIVVNIYIFFRLYSFEYINIHKNDVRDKEEINKYGKQYKFWNVETEITPLLRTSYISSAVYVFNEWI